MRPKEGQSILQPKNFTKLRMLARVTAKNPQPQIFLRALRYFALKNLENREGAKSAKKIRKPANSPQSDPKIPG
jgi:hypothetical protein